MKNDTLVKQENTMTSDGLIMMTPPLNGSFEYLGAFSENDVNPPLSSYTPGVYMWTMCATLMVSLLF